MRVIYQFLITISFVFMLSACGGSGGGDSNHTIGGSVSGLTGTVVLQNNSSDDLILNTDGDFTFSTAIVDGTTYAVSVSSQPSGQTCTLSNAAGTLSGNNITSVSVTCADAVNVTNHTIGGSVSGLTGTVVLQNNGSDDLILNTDGDFTFSAAIVDGAAYAVSVSSQPSVQTCTLSNAEGTVSGSNITNVSIFCASRGLSFVSYGISTKDPSVIRAAYRVIDSNTGEPVDGLNAEDFHIVEDGAEVNSLESFKALDPIESSPIPLYLKTVLAIDISSSLSLSDLDQIKATVKAIIIDPSSASSNLQVNHQVAIYTFDGTVTQVSAFTSDISVLSAAIDGITRGGPSTNLYGAITAGLSQWTDNISVSPLSTNNSITLWHDDYYHRR